eukprot:477943-Alexandrium_andersonii.AAC.1
MQRLALPRPGGLPIPGHTHPKSGAESAQNCFEQPEAVSSLSPTVSSSCVLIFLIFKRSSWP